MKIPLPPLGQRNVLVTDEFGEPHWVDAAKNFGIARWSTRDAISLKEDEAVGVSAHVRQTR